MPTSSNDLNPNLLSISKYWSHLLLLYFEVRSALILLRIIQHHITNICNAVRVSTSFVKFMEPFIPQPFKISAFELGTVNMYKP